jgi:lysophospholipase L1-like esterase
MMDSINPETKKHTKNISIRNVIIKGLFLFGLANILFAILQPLPFFGNISAYNLLFPGRKRLPYSDNPDNSYNLTLLQLNAMFASHEIHAGSKNPDEFRIIVLGDSATWGFLLKPDETLSGQLNFLNIIMPDGRKAHAYNLGYPGLSVTKDLLVLSNAMQFQPDMIIWMVTLESFPNNKQLSSPLIQHNPNQLKKIITQFNLDINLNDASFVNPSFWQNTIIGQRKVLANMIRLQFYGVMWAATGIDQYIPPEYTPAMEDLQPDLDFEKLKPPHLNTSQMAFPVIVAGLEMSNTIPLLVVNEPIFVSRGENSDIRYNFYYPRWAYDDYRQLLDDFCQEYNIPFLDLWNSIDPEQFTNTAIHMNPDGTAQTARKLVPFIINSYTGY